jgi:hypothetical protein
MERRHQVWCNQSSVASRSLNLICHSSPPLVLFVPARTQLQEPRVSWSGKLANTVTHRIQCTGSQRLVPLGLSIIVSLGDIVVFEHPRLRYVHAQLNLLRFLQECFVRLVGRIFGRIFDGLRLASNDALRILQVSDIPYGLSWQIKAPTSFNSPDFIQNIASYNDMSISQARLPDKSGLSRTHL